MNKFDEKIAEALFIYLQQNSFRDRFYYALVYEHKPFNQYHLYMFEPEDSPEKEASDLIVTYAIDYDEGQEIDVFTNLFTRRNIYRIVI